MPTDNQVPKPSSPECPKCGGGDYEQTQGIADTAHWVCWECGYVSEPI